MEILVVNIDVARVQDFAELKSAENLRRVHLICGRDFSIGDILPTVKRWRHLHKLFFIGRKKRSDPRSKVLCDFILEMKHLTSLTLYVNCVKPESLRDKVNKIVLPRRPNFHFNMFHIIMWFTSLIRCCFVQSGACLIFNTIWINFNFEKKNWMRLSKILAFA